jgi:hypothetical protein
MSMLEETLAPYCDKRWHFTMTVSCPEGWVNIVLDTHAKLVEIAPDYNLLQIKEKFGGLRYYASADGLSDDARAQFQEIINLAEAESYKTCETCGTTENTSTKPLGDGYYWTLTLCDFCRLQQLAERIERDARFKADYEAPDDEEE